jgi:hypothetical protein
MEGHKSRGRQGGRLRQRGQGASRGSVLWPAASAAGLRFAAAAAAWLAQGAASSRSRVSIVGFAGSVFTLPGRRVKSLRANDAACPSKGWQNRGGGTGAV